MHWYEVFEVVIPIDAISTLPGEVLTTQTKLLVSPCGFKTFHQSIRIHKLIKITKYGQHVHMYVNIVFCLMVFNPTFNNISVISWRSVLLVKETTDLSQVTDKLLKVGLNTIKQNKQY
jgi:hypothetical protein